MPFMLRAGTFGLMFQRVLDLSIVIFRYAVPGHTRSQGGLCNGCRSFGPSSDAAVPGHTRSQGGLCTGCRSFGPALAE